MAEDEISYHHIPSSNPARCPGGLEIEAAGDAVNVQQFAGKKQSGTNTALHGFEIHLVQPDPAAGHELILVQALSVHGKFRAPQLLNELVLCGPRERRPSHLA